MNNSETTIKQYEDSLYVLTNDEYYTLDDAYEMLEDYDVEYVGQDDGVASYNGYDTCFVFHII